MSVLNFRLVVRAIDEATAPLRRVNAAVRSMTDPLRRVGQAAGRFVRESGLPALVGQAGEVGAAFGRVGQEARRMALTVAAAIGLTGGGLAALVRRSADVGDNLGKMSQRLGISVGQLQGLSYAAGQSGSSAEGLADAFRYLGNNATQAARGGAEQRRVFEALGVSVTDANGAIRSSDELLLDLADAFAAMEDGALKSHLAQQLFGRGGAELIPMLNEGRAGIEALMEAQRRLGHEWTDEQIRAATAFGDALGNLWVVLGGIRDAISVELMPVFHEWVVALQEAALAAKPDIVAAFREALERLRDALPDIQAGLQAVWGGIQTFAGAVGDLVQFIGGWENAIVAVALAFSASLVAALGLAAASVIKFGALLMTTPVGWFLAAVAAIAAAAYLIHQNWDGIVDYFSELWDAVVAGFDQGLVQGVLAVLANFTPWRIVADAWVWIIREITGIDIRQVIADQVDSWMEAIGRFDPLAPVRAAWEAVLAWIAGIDLIGPLRRKVSEAVDAVVGILPGWARSALGIDGALPGGDALTPSGAALGAAAGEIVGRQEVGGRLDIHIDAEGRPTVQRLESNSRNFDFTVDRGLMMGVP